MSPATELESFFGDDDDDLILVDPYECHAPSRRSDRELADFIALLNSLEQGKVITQ
jgi:hypothetical protein